MRALSPLELALAGTIAIHLIVITAADAIIVTHPRDEHERAPHIEMVDVEVPAVVLPPPPPVTPTAPPDPVTPPAVAPPPPTHAPPPHAIRTAPTPSQPETPPATPPAAPPLDPTPTAGGEQVVHMDNIAPSATGVAVAPGAPSTGHIGRGGTGGGGGSGVGTGAGSGEAPLPMSVATIKTRALPKAGFDYLDVGRDYPEEAKQLGIEGDLRVRLVVDVRGKVVQSRLLNHLGHGLDELALARAAAIEFTPAVDTGGSAVTSVVVWTFAMHLPK